jgi:hypothetical protein
MTIQITNYTKVIFSGGQVDVSYSFSTTGPAFTADSRVAITHTITNIYGGNATFNNGTNTLTNNVPITPYGDNLQGNGSDSFVLNGSPCKVTIAVSSAGNIILPSDPLYVTIEAASLLAKTKKIFSKLFKKSPQPTKNV